MNRFLNITFILAIVSLGIAQGNKQVYAQEDPFVTNYDVNYLVEPTGLANITQNISIENLERDVVATNYTLTIRKMNISSVSADSPRGGVQVEEVREKDKTDINLTFENTVIGQGRRNEFSIKYATQDIASKTGGVWNVNIPRVNLLDNTQNYLVTLTIPKAFGPEIFVSPQPLIKEETENVSTYVFNKNTLDKTGITASFGKYQVLNFNLEYDLVNNSNFDTTKTIALPPDLSHIQQISYNEITPEPKKIYRDEDNNVLADYKLEGKETINVKVVGTARILSRQINPEFGYQRKDIPKDLVDKYTSANEFWNSDQPQIQKIADDLFNEEETISQNVQKAYNFTTQNLEYDFDILEQDYVERKGGAHALSQKMGTGCMEFTDLFISISRAMGIPTRELNGYAIPSDSTETPLSISLDGGDLLHSWAEFYDPEFGWVPVDPTWGSTSGIDYFTKLDNNHLVFVVKGEDPLEPLPAGTYKQDPNKKQVQVEVANSEVEEDFEPKVEVFLGTTINPISLLNKSQKYYLKNIGTAALVHNGVEILPTQYIPITIKDSDFETTEAVVETENAQRIYNIQVEDTLGKGYNLNAKINEESLDNETAIYGLLVLSVLLLCVMIYVLIFRLQVQRIIFLLLTGRLRDQDQ